MSTKHNQTVNFYGVDFQVYFSYSPYRPATLEQPEEHEEIEIESVIAIGGKEVLDQLTEKEYNNIKEELWKSR